MPVNPEQGAVLAQRVLAIYERAEQVLLIKVARRLKRGLTDESWAEQKLAEITQLRKDAEEVVKELSEEMPREVVSVVEEAADLGYDEAHRDLSKKLPEVKFSATNPFVVRTVASEAIGDLEATHLRIFRTTEDVYRDTITEVTGAQVAGADTRRDATQRALNRFADKGVTGFVDKAGRNWDLASYSEMATRTASARASIGGHLEGLLDLGKDLIMVTDVGQECPICRPWEGEVLSITGASKDHKSLATAMAAGLLHPNCRHNISVYLEGITKPVKNTEDPEGDKLRQQQRYMERQIRRWKRREAVGDPMARARVHEWRSRLKDHVEAHDLKRLRYRESPMRAREEQQS